MRACCPPAAAQLLTGAKIIDCDMSLEGDRRLYTAANKLLGLLITLGSALAYVLSGMYGDVRDLGAFTAILLIVQLSFAGMIVLTLDDLLQKGYGLGSGIDLATSLADEPETSIHVLENSAQAPSMKPT